MRFTRIGDLEVVTRITGPTHHFLGIALAPVPSAETPILERVSLDHPQAEVEPPDPENELCREVLETVRDINDRLGTQFGVTRIRYCSDDPPVPGIYRRLTQALVFERVISETEASLQPSFEQTDGCHDHHSSERT
jgi:hypothetical protein